MALSWCRLNYPTKGFALNFLNYVHLPRLNFLLLKGCKDISVACPHLKAIYGCNEPFMKNWCAKTCSYCKYVSKFTGSLFMGKKAIVDRKYLIHENVTDLRVVSMLMGQDLSEFRKNPRFISPG